MDVDACANCGGAELLPLSNERFRCTYCNAILRRKPPDPGETQLVINRGAKVRINRGANVTVHGKVYVRDGADVTINGNFEIIERGDPKKRRR